VNTDVFFQAKEQLHPQNEDPTGHWTGAESFCGLPCGE